MANALVALDQQAPRAPGLPTGDLGKKRAHFRAFEENKKREVDEQRESRRYYHGKQWTDEQLRVLKDRNQPVTTDNRIKRKVDFLVGVEQRMRRDPKAYPRTPQHTQAADVVTAGIRFVCDKNRWEDKASDAAHDGMVGGIGLVWIGAEGQDPKIKSGTVDRFFYDSRSVKPDFSDCRHMGMHLWLDVEDAKGMWPQHEARIEQMVDRNADASVSWVETDRAEQWGDYENQRIRVIEFWEKRHTPQGEHWYYCFFSGDIELDSGWSPYLDEDGKPDCPYVAWSPYIDEKGDRYGLIRDMRPIQDAINFRSSKLLHRISVRQVHVRKGFVEDVDVFRKENAKPDGVIEHEGKWGEDVGPVDQSFEAKGEAELLAQAQASLENLGPNPGLIGKGGGVADQSGRAILAQRDSGMTELSPVFERLRDFKLRCYRKMWARMRQTWTDERWITVTDDPNAPGFIRVNGYGFDPETQHLTAENIVSQMDVDIILDEGPDTILMQEELLQTFTQLGEAAMTGMGKIVIELSNVPNKERLIKMIDEAQAPNPEIAEMQRKMAEFESKLAAGKVDESKANVESKTVDSFTKLLQALTPQAAPTDEFGNQTAPAPQPNIAAALQAMEILKRFNAPSTEQETDMQAAAAAQQQQMAAQAGGQMPPEQGPMPGQPMPPMPMGPPPMLPPEGQMMEPMFNG
jgi:hypothetical protein